MLEDALLKLLAALPSAHRHDAERTRQRIVLDSSGWFQARESVPYLAMVQEAVWQDRKLQISYRRNDNQQIERTIDPYGLVAKTSIWYVVGAAESGLRIYRISRILAASLCEEHFERPADFDLADYWKTKSAEFEASRPRYPVTLRIAPLGIPLLPHIFGEWVYELIAQADPPDEQGWTTLQFTFESFEASLSYALGLSTFAEVLAPPDLREKVVNIAAEIVRLYGQP